MKKLILGAIAVVAFAATTEVKANSLTQPVTSTVQDSVTKTPVKLEELPDAVKATLQSDQVKEWTPSTAFLVKNSKGEEYYQIDVAKGEEKTFLRIAKDGKLIQ